MNEEEFRETISQAIGLFYAKQDYMQDCEFTWPEENEYETILQELTEFLKRVERRYEDERKEMVAFQV
jgi:cysteinyl-tRNA synthetase